MSHALRADIFGSLCSPYSHLSIGRDRVMAANQDALKAAVHWGVPTLAFDGDPSLAKIALSWRNDGWNRRG